MQKKQQDKKIQSSLLQAKTLQANQLWISLVVYLQTSTLKAIRAVICVAYTDEIPTCESDIEHAGTKIANFYTVWSYDRGAGREIVFEVANHIKKTNTDVERFVTLSPLTEMAKNFHLKITPRYIHLSYIYLVIQN